MDATGGKTQPMARAHSEHLALERRVVCHFLEQPPPRWCCRRVPSSQYRNKTMRSSQSSDEVLVCARAALCLAVDDTSCCVPCRTLRHGSPGLPTASVRFTHRSTRASSGTGWQRSSALVLTNGGFPSRGMPAKHHHLGSRCPGDETRTGCWKNRNRAGHRPPRARS